MEQRPEFGIGAYVFPRFATYQDVRRNLTLGTIALLVLVCMFFARYVLSSDHRAQLLSTTGVQDDALVALAKDVVALAVLMTPLAVLFVHFLEVHQRVFDTYVVRWRDRFERRRVVPRLLLLSEHPQAARLWMRIRDQRPERYLRQLYYEPFVDHRGGSLMNAARLERFHEAITAYWLTQIAQICLGVLAVITVAYWGITSPAEIGSRATAATAIVVALASAVLAARPARRRAERAIERQVEYFALRYPQRLRRAIDRVLVELDEPPLPSPKDELDARAQVLELRI